MNDETSTVIDAAIDSAAETDTADAAANDTAEKAAASKRSGNRSSGKQQAAGNGEETDSQAAKSLSRQDVADIVQAALKDYATAQEKRQSEAQKLASMDAQQKLEYERDSAQQQLQQLKEQMALAEMQSTARAMLAEQGIHAPDGILQAIVTTDAEQTKANVEGFAELFQEAVQAAVKNQLRQDPPKTGKTGSGLTKEQILAVKDNDKRVKLIRENMDLFSSF